jgi:hypothetical protein
LSLIILHAHGGYYLDTTTIVTPGIDEGTLNRNLNTTYSTPRVPLIGGETPHQILLQTGTSIVAGFDLDPEERSGSSLMQNVALIDVWALYSPPRHVSLELMFISYVSRCNRMGLYPGGAEMNFSEISGDKVMSEPKKGRNDLIGNLVVRSVLDGLLVKCCEFDGRKLPNFCWRTEGTGDESRLGKYKVPALGINKVYRNSWRGAAAS